MTRVASSGRSVRKSHDLAGCARAPRLTDRRVVSMRREPLDVSTRQRQVSGVRIRAPSRRSDQASLGDDTGSGAARGSAAALVLHRTLGGSEYSGQRGCVSRSQVEGPGLIKVHPGGKGSIDLSAFGTTPDTTLNITQVRPRYHFPSRLLSIHKLTVTSGQLGGSTRLRGRIDGNHDHADQHDESFTIGAARARQRTLKIIGSVG